jgi:CBS-domain-containing membrane protein
LQLKHKNNMKFLEKLKGDGAALPPQPSSKAVGLAWLGGVLAIAAVAALADFTSLALVLGSFGASCVLVFGYPDAPFSQPRNIIVGHALSSLVGLAFLTIFGPHWWSIALAVGTAIALMMLTRTVHPPAGSNPVIVFLTQPSWGFLLFPTIVGALILVVVALIYNNATRDAKYPKYW